MGNIVQFGKSVQEGEKRRQVEKMKKLNAMKKICSCTGCALKCTRCATRVDVSQGYSCSTQIPCRFFTGCEEEFRDFLDSREGQGTRGTPLARPRMDGYLGGVDRISEGHEKIRKFQRV